MLRDTVNESALRVKASGHGVGVSEAGFYVKSGESGEGYTLAVFDGELVCSCKWGRFGGTNCSHALALHTKVAAARRPVILAFL